MLEKKNKQALAFSILVKGFQSYINFKRKHGAVLFDTVFVLDIVYITPNLLPGAWRQFGLKKVAGGSSSIWHSYALYYVQYAHRGTFY